MKKFLGLVVLFVLVLFTFACGGSSSKKAPVSAANSQESPTVQARLTDQQESPTKTAVSNDPLGVVGKGCPANVTKVTSKDLGEAFINTLCSDLANGKIFGPQDSNSAPDYHVLGFRPEGVLRVDSIVFQGGSTNAYSAFQFVVIFENCSDCPRSFTSPVKWVVNPLGEWQLSGNPINLTEIAESVKAKVLRDVRIEVLSSEFTYTSGFSFKSSQINIQGDPARLSLLCQLEDGRTTVINKSFLSEYIWQEGNDPIQEGLKLKILAYKFGKYTYDSDWIYLNK